MANQSLFENSLNRLKFFFAVSGLILERRKVVRWQITKKRCIYIINTIWLSIEVIGSIFWFIDNIKNGKDMAELTTITPCSLIATLSKFKTLYLIINERSVNDLVDILRELDVNEMDFNIEAKNIIAKKEKRTLDSVIKSFNALSFGLLVAFSFMPLILIAIKYVETKELELALPFLVLYPFDSFNIKYWPFVYLKQIWSESVVLSDMCASDYFYYICCTYIRIQFRFLSYEFENLIPNKHNKRDDDQSDIKQKIIKLIKWHQRLIRSTNTLELIYSKSTLINFISSSAIICLTGFNVTIMNDVVILSSFVTFLFLSLLQIFFLCFFGDMLMSASMEVSDAVYNSLWYIVDRGVAKDLLLVQIRAHTPCKLTAFGFSDVNLTSFAKIISSSWSYFALLNTIYSNKQN
ncbi:odorant receptor 67c-like [Battus philenor]|uniref:odorant receptor 67c-like n=1 Tax=Battus philenor TaxID=42288 RepID=UPI0035D0A19B